MVTLEPPEKIAAGSGALHAEVHCGASAADASHLHRETAKALSRCLHQARFCLPSEAKE